jgi:hypothetical protein
MHLVKYYNIDEVHAECRSEEDSTELRANNKRNREDKWCEEEDYSLIYLWRVLVFSNKNLGIR